MGPCIGRGTWHHMWSVVNGLAKFLCGISRDGSSCDSLLRWLENIIDIIYDIFHQPIFFVFVKKQQRLECLMSNFLSDSASTSLQVNSTRVCDPCRRRNWRRQTPCVTLSFFCFSVLLRPVHRCRHCQSEAQQPHRKKCVFQSQDNCAPQILRAP